MCLIVLTKFLVSSVAIFTFSLKTSLILTLRKPFITIFHASYPAFSRVESAAVAAAFEAVKNENNYRSSKNRRINHTALPVNTFHCD